MKIHLIYPNLLSGNAGGTQEPLGILYVASALRQAGYQVTLNDLTFSKSLREIASSLQKAEILGIGCSTPLFGQAIDVLKNAKEIKPSLFSMVGGPHSTQDPLDALEKGFDAVLLGEAERNVVSLCSSLEKAENWKTCPGIAFLQDSSMHVTAHGPFVANLDDLPWPARDLIDQRRYLKRNGYVSLINTRGCPYQCLYCKPMQDKLFGKKCRSRSPGNVAEEIQKVQRDFGASRIYFKDDTLLLCGQEWFEELEQEFHHRNIRVGWYCLGRVDQVNESLLLTMKRFGLEAIAFGVESGSQRILDFYRKGTTPQQAKEAFQLCHKHGVMTHAYVMLGAPDETVTDLNQTLDLVRDLTPYSSRMFVVTPFPGNDLHRYAQEHDLCEASSYREWDNALNLVQGRLPMKLEYLTARDIQRYARKIRQATLWGNVKRCLTSWRDFKLALAHLRIAFNMALKRL